MSISPVAETARPSAGGARLTARAQDATWLGIICLTLLAAGLRFWRIGHQSFWYDESATLLLVHHSFGRMVSLVQRSQGTPPLYFCLAWIWARLFGFGEAGLRSLSAVAGVAVVPLAYGIGTRLVSRRAGFMAAALVACNPLLIWYSQEARAYSLLVLASTVALLAFVHLLSSSPSRPWLITWALAAALALTTHYYAVLAVAPQALWLLWIHRRDLRAWLAVASVATVGVALVPFAVSQQLNGAPWITMAPLSLRLGQIGPQFLLGTGAPDRSWLKLAGTLALLMAAAMLVRRADARERRGAVLAGGLAAAGFALSLLLVAVGIDKVITRNLIVVLIALILLVACGLGARRAGLLGSAGTWILCAIGLIATIAVASDANLQRAPWRDVARALESGRPAGAAEAILQENTSVRVPLADYMPGLHPMRAGASVKELDVVAEVRAPSVAFCWWGAACFLEPVPLDSSIRMPGFHADGPVVHVHQFSIYRLRSTRTVFVTRSEIARALSKTQLRGYGLFVRSS